MDKRKTSIRLFISAYKHSSLVFQTLNKEILLRIYEFSEDTQLKLESYLEGFENYTDSSFEENIIEKQEKKVNEMCNSLLSLFRWGTGNNFTEIDSHKLEKLTSKAFLEFFYGHTKYVKDVKIKLIDIEDELLDKIEARIIKTVNGIIKLNAIKIVKDALIFDEVFSIRKKNKLKDVQMHVGNC